MDNLWQLVPMVIPMVVLMACSAFFSASEAALFYLKPKDLNEMESGGPSEKAAAALLDDPDRLLSAILFWNLVINMAYFSIASIAALRLERESDFGKTGAATFAAAALLAIIFFSEMLPKSVAVLKPRSLAGMASLMLYWAVRIVDPLMPALQSVNLISRRLIWPGFKPEPFMEVSDLERAIEHSGANSSVIRQEQEVLQNIVQLSTIRIEEWMRPRTQFQSFQPPVRVADLNGNASGKRLSVGDRSW